MASYPYMVKTAWNVLETVVAQWHNEPYRWMRERDLQAEIGGRLNQIFSLQGLGTVTGEHKWVTPGFDRRQSWSRVSYEPYIYYEYEPGSSSNCHPDIVIWDDLGEGEVIPDAQLWPILWACELKYGSPSDGSDDVEKLRKLINQKKIQYGCSVRVKYVKDHGGVGLKWRTAGTELGQYLWVCDVSMPVSEEPRE